MRPRGDVTARGMGLAAVWAAPHSASSKGSCRPAGESRALRAQGLTAYRRLSPCPAEHCNAMTRRPAGLARGARCAPKSPRVNQPSLARSTSVNGNCVARKKTAAICGLPHGYRQQQQTAQTPAGGKSPCPKGTHTARPRSSRSGYKRRPGGLIQLYSISTHCHGSP